MFHSSSVLVWIQSSILHLSSKASDSQGRTKRVTFSFPDDSRSPWGWVKAYVNSQTEHNIIVTVAEEESELCNATFDIPMSTAQGMILPAHDWGRNSNEAHSRVGPALGPDDFIHLPYFHEVELVHGLKRRFLANQIYTYAGPVLIAVNPFEARPEFYDAQIMKQYHFMSRPDSLPPHAFAVAERAYRSMLSRQHLKQSILVAGESGSGKTMTTKFIMSYLAEASLRHAIAAIRFEQPLLSCNSILESLANARTVHNDNSSRFGKYIELFFTTDGALLGAKVESHLLEKTRLVQQGPGERNFHIFYELLAGASSIERELYLLEDTDAQDFVMTCLSGTFDRRDKVSDAEQFLRFQQGMTRMNFSQEEQHDVLRLIAALLHMSNLSVVEIEEGASELDFDNPCLPAALQLLGIGIDDLNSALCCVSVEGCGQTFSQPQPVISAEKGIEDLIKALYSAFFDFVMFKVNLGCAAGELNPQLHTSIGVLDVFGFECFDKNSLEQLCANYCSDVLQQHFNSLMFRFEKAEYSLEEISWDLFPIPDNQETLDIIEHQVFGVFSVLEHHCRLPRANDETFATDLYKKCAFHSSFEASARQVSMKRFSIKHFSGDVEYDTLDFVATNRDDVPRKTIDLFTSSTNVFVRRLGASMIKDRVENSYEIAQGVTKRATAVRTLKRQLHLIRNKINDTSPHFIRCLKSNNNFAPGSFNPGLIARQLRYSGVLEVGRLSREGYSQHFLHADFISRYSVLLQSKAPKCRGDMPLNSLASEKISKLPLVQINPRNYDGDLSLRNLCQRMVADPSFAVRLLDDVHVGKNKVFLRLQGFNDLELIRNQKLRQAAVAIQTVWRRCLAERCFIITYCCVLMLQSHCRRLLSKKSVGALKTFSDKREYDTQSENGNAEERDVTCRMKALQDQSVQNAEMTIKWLAQNVEELRESMKSGKSCYDGGSKNVAIPFTTRRHEKLASVKSNLLEEENEFMRLNLQKMNDEIVALREIVMPCHHRPQYSVEKEKPTTKSVVDEMQILRKHIERMRKDIVKTKTHITSLAPAYECNLRMRNAATNEIQDLEKEKYRLSLHRFGRSSASLNPVKIA